MKSSVTNSDSLNLILLLESIWVSWSLWGIDELISKAFRHRFDVSERGFSGSSSQKYDSLVDSSEWRNINSLSLDSTSRSDSGRVFSGSAVSDGIDDDFDWVLASEEMDDFHSLLHDSDGQLFLSVVSSFSHDGVHDSFDEWALDFSEFLGLVFSSSVWDEDLSFVGFDVQIWFQWDIVTFNTFIRPSSVEEWFDSVDLIKISLF